MVEKRGVTIEEKLRRSNPWKDEACGRPNRFPCQSGGGGSCWREGVTYSLVCKEYGRRVAEYFGETGRNTFTRVGEHLLNLTKLAEDENKSVLKFPSNHCHDGRDVRYTMRVTGVHNDSLERQITEAVNIANFRGPALMNRRGELGGVRIASNIGGGGQTFRTAETTLRQLWQWNRW